MAIPTARFVHRCVVSRWIQNISTSRALSKSPNVWQELSSWPALSFRRNIAACLSISAQFTDEHAGDPAKIATPGLLWMILVNNRPLYPYPNLDRIVNPWGYGSFQVLDSTR